MGLVIVVGHSGEGAVSSCRQVGSSSYSSDLAVRRTGSWQRSLARLLLWRLAAVPDLVLVVDADAGTPARVLSPCTERRLEPLDGGAR